MQKFKMTAEEVNNSLKNLKKERNDELKEIKGLYQELENKQNGPFEATLDRVHKNLGHYKETEYRAMSSNFSSRDVTQKY